MNPQNRILISGINGFLGTEFYKTFKALGYDVWGLARNSFNNKVIKVDLINYEQLKAAADKIPKIDTLIHTAGWAHGQSNYSNLSIVEYNLNITENIISVFEGKINHFVFISSVSVYQNLKSNQYTSVEDIPNPQSDYGKSKLLSENVVLKSKIKNHSVLRLCPVFDDNHLGDIKKRVYLPGSSFLKIKIKPSPKYSLTHIKTLTKTLISIIIREEKGSIIYNISDAEIYDQNDLLKWFPGIVIYFPEFIFRPILFAINFLPNSLKIIIRENYNKLFYSNIYLNDYTHVK